MICPVCRKEIPDGMTVCPICGAVLSAPQHSTASAPNAALQYVPTAAQNAFPQYAPTASPYSTPAQMPTSVKQFVKQCTMIPGVQYVGREINVACIFFYISAVAKLIYGLIVNGLDAGSLIFYLVDALIVGGLALWLHLTYSRVASIILLVISALSFILSFISGQGIGIWVVLISIFAVVCTFKAAKMFKDYKQSAVSNPPVQ